MTVKRKKPTRRAPDLTVEADYYCEFADEPRGDGNLASSAGVVTSYDPAVAAFAERLKKTASPKKRSLSANGNSEQRVRKGTEAGHRPIQNLASLLDDCLRTAGAIKNKRATQLVKLLRDARRQVELIDAAGR